MKARALLALLLAAALAGCGSAQLVHDAVQAPMHLMADERFAPPSEAIDTSTLFTLSPAMQAYLRSPRYRQLVRDLGNERGLIEALYKEGDLKLDYDASLTRPAAQTFEAKSGNCMSLVIMTAAFAKELNFRLTFQEVRVDESWSREGSLYLGSAHVNIMLGLKSVASAREDSFVEALVVDFLPPDEAARYRTSPLPESAIVAMYANNRAAEALADGRVDDAYWWSRKALAEHPGLEMAYNTLGVVYQRHGDHAMAERVFREVLARDAENRVAMNNLVPVLEALGKHEEAGMTRKVLAKLEPAPPFHYFQLGQAAMARQDYRLARDLFARELARAPYYHEFHFWHALASLRLGENEAARKQLVRALATSTTPDNRARYAAKLEHLRASLPPSRRR